MTSPTPKSKLGKNTSQLPANYPRKLNKAYQKMLADYPRMLNKSSLEPTINLAA